MSCSWAEKEVGPSALPLGESGRRPWRRWGADRWSLQAIEGLWRRGGEMRMPSTGVSADIQVPFLESGRDRG
jgi:hypothetical protein